VRLGFGLLAFAALQTLVGAMTLGPDIARLFAIEYTAITAWLIWRLVHDDR
jgi:hypothetical protein